ncbi:putative leucine-rich repeat-containing, plant-type, leucine-rich repeat domain, L [Medicago truncatula]|uniref:Putative leucine-rich repeat-containing, plant-type, leucine-rich repeat domain, L n=1 Tax=Medicago truncatula TaxID=3880 RepID=A0A396GT30_MEDTR|nr:putative leucine-rich repeat-containing, plant-type, leucine-rich repeat domain, L [Medicago truncatula]
MVFVWSHVLFPKCHQYESHALLQFKEGFVINNLASDDLLGYPKTSSWNSSTDCCSWDGIKCHKHTDHVIHINLSSSQLYGTMDANSSLFRLVHLRVLDLSDNNFNYSKIPTKIGELSQLKFLNLSLNLFSGEIPRQVSQLSKLLSLDLGFRAIVRPKVGVFHLPNLELLDLRYNPNLNGRLPEFESSSLTELALGGTGFSGTLPVSIGKVSSLIVLGIPDCRFFGFIPSSLGNLTQLEQISLKNNKFRGDPSASLANLTKLSLLNVGFNEFTIETFSWVDKLSSLFALDISHYLSQISRN